MLRGGGQVSVSRISRCTGRAEMTQRKLRLPKLSFSAREQQRKEPQPPYRAVEIRCTANSCEAAKALSGQRHLCREAPLLPLVSCDRPDRCECQYRHFDDRRAGSRRTSDATGVHQVRNGAEERRQMHGRRAEDRAEDFGDEFEDSTSLLEDTYYEYMLKRDDD